MKKALLLILLVPAVLLALPALFIFGTWCYCVDPEGALAEMR